MWLRHAHTRVREVDLAAGVVDAEHDGYTRLPGPPVHRRWLIAPRNDRSQLVVEIITGSGNHEVIASWPLHPSLDAKPIPHGHIVSRDDSAIAQLLYASTVTLMIDGERGNVVENLGWWSDRLESRTPAWWLGAVGNGDLPIVTATLITPMDGHVTNGLSVELQSGRITVHWLEDAKARAVDISVRER
jgi:hypothetical protein